VISVIGPELLSIRWIAEEFGKRLCKPVQYVGEESNDALLSNPRKAYQLFGRPRMRAQQMMDWIADWVNVIDDCGSKQDSSDPPSQP
jgi:hypothetical protein